MAITIKDMQKKVQDWVNHQQNIGQDNFTNPVGSSNYTVFGTGGSARHTGNFSTDNPYFKQLQLANNNADKDALYERAIEWEADYANLTEQRDYAREVLEEQRAYDDPSAVVARQRAAGINPDLSGGSAGSSGSAGSAQQVQPQMSDQSASSEFSNKYDNSSLIFEGISTASNFVNSLSSGVSGILNAVSTFKLMPSQIALNEANASLGNAKANEITELLPGNKKSLELLNAFQGVRNGTAILQQLAEFSDLIAPDTEDFTPILKSLGVDEANIAPYSDIIKQMHANPQMRDKYAKAEVAAKFSEAENQATTSQLVSEIVDLQYKAAYEKKFWDFHTNHLQRQIASLLDIDEFAEKTASNTISEAGLTEQAIDVKQKDLQYQLTQIEQNTTALLQGIQDRAQALKILADTRDKLTPKDRIPTHAEQAILNRITAEEISLRNILADEFYKIKDSYLNVAQQVYNRYHRLDSDGNFIPAASLEVGNMFNDAVFNDLIYHTKTPGEIAKGWVDTTVSAAGVAVQGFGVAKGYSFVNAYRDAHSNRSKNVGYKEGWKAAESYYRP